MNSPHLPAERGETLPGFDPATPRPLIARGLARLAQPAALRVLWRFAVRGSVRSAPAEADGVIYVVSYDGTGDGNVYALDAATGAERWRFTAPGRVSFTPAAADGVVYVSSSDDNSDGNICALIPPSHNHEVRQHLTPPTL